MAKIVLLTGASTGIGKDIALTLLDRGYKVYGAARRVELMKDIESKGGKALSLDVSRPESCAAAVEAVIKAEGRIDVLINNAGYGSFGAIEDVPLEEARRQFDVNVFGLAHLMQLVIPHMKAQKSGRIVNISSVVGRTALPLMAWYCASKHAVEALSDSARLELRHLGIGVSLIEPGMVESEFKQVAFDHLDKSNIGADYTLIAENMTAYQAKRAAAPASSVSRTVIMALESPRPRARYIPNADSYWGQAARRWLGDGLYDWGVTTVLGRKRR